MPSSIVSGGNKSNMSGEQMGACRWHSSSCSNPRISLVRRGPKTKIRCKTCGRVPPSVEDAIKSQSSSDPPMPELPDRPLGELDLWWPEHVPWARRPDRETREYTSPRDVKRQRPNSDQSRRVKPRLVDSSSTIYPFRLAWSEVRLACLTASTDDDSPVHLMLETYTDDSCPEYEAVSYTWGGEEDDPKPRRSVFVGTYWDVLPQTENCWQMLRFLRPRRGVRLVWVDAICINQRDIEERGDQVSKMDRIYRRCMRAILYLGPDAAPVLRDGRFPHRRDFNDIDKQELQGMLARRYFRRTWVIQELVLSPHIVVRLGDTDYHIWSASMSRFKMAVGYSLERTLAPWVEHLTQQELRVRDHCEALHLTSNSQCSDPRDRLFGILSLLSRRDGFGDMSLRADYSISNQHMWIGFFAYYLLKCDTTWFLYRAVGTSATGAVLSWIPDWKSSTSWKRFRPPLDWGEHGYTIDYLIDNGMVPRSVLPPNIYMVSCPRLLADSGVVGPGPAFPVQFKSATVCPATGALLGIRLQRLFTIPSAPTRVTDIDIIDTTQRFIPIPSAPTRVTDIDTTEGLGRAEDDTYRLFVIIHEAANMFLASDKPLDELVCPGKDHLFLLYSTSPPVVLILREIDSTASDDGLPDSSTSYTRSRPISVPTGSRFRVVVACPFIYFDINEPNIARPTFPKNMPLPNIPYYSDDYNSRLKRVKVDNMSGFEHTDKPSRDLPSSINVNSSVTSMEQRTMYRLIEECHADLSQSPSLPCFKHGCGGQCLFLDSRPRRDHTGSNMLIWLVLSLFWAIVQDLLRERDLEESYVSCLNPRVSPHVKGPYIHVSVKPGCKSEFDTAFDEHMDDHDLSLSLWQWRLDDGDWSPLSQLAGHHRDAAVTSRTLSFRADMKSLAQDLRKTESIFISALLALRRLSILSADSSPQEITDALQHPKEEYRSILLEGRLGPFTADGRYYDIDIL